jgi:hypothetical protein
VSCIQGEKNLIDLLSNQKECVAKEGIGFDPSSKKKNKKKIGPTPPPPRKKVVFVHEGHKEKEKGKRGILGTARSLGTRPFPKILPARTTHLMSS